MFNIFSREGLISFLYFLPALLISLSIHEFAHSFIAYKLGDKSQKALGRMTLNPLAHIDLWGFVCIALFSFGWGKPVIVDDRNFKNRSRDNMLVALAGPMSNILLSIVFTIILKILMITGVVDLAVSTTSGNLLTNMLVLSIQFNVIFGIFNMLPIPPFDGSKVLFYFLPGKYKEIMYVLERYSFIIILILVFTNISSYIISPMVSGILKLLNIILMI